MEEMLFSEDMQEIVESFVVETREIFEQLDTDLIELEQRPDDAELVNRIFRAVHTVKGTAGFLGLEAISHLTHNFEDVLNRLRKGDIQFEPSMLDVMLEAFDWMKVLLQQVENRKLEPVDLGEIVGKLKALTGKEPAKEGEHTLSEEAPQTVADEENSSSERQDVAPEESVAASEDSTDQVASKSEASPVVEQGSPEPEKKQSAQPSRLEKAASAARKAADKLKLKDSTIRVEVNRLDHLMNLVGELVLGRNRLSQVTEALHHGEGDAELWMHRLVETTSQIDLITTELQSALIKVRMVPVGRVFSRFPRVVRDIAREFNKKIDLVIEGEDTELDKSLIEELGDPLLHLVRNAADHGIETPEERVKAGKPEKGRIRLAAEYEGNYVVIYIEDDGKGMDPEKLKKKAIDVGILSREEAASMSDEEAFALIFRPGFSTADKVSKVSGRGVGMDVVKTNLSRLNGTIEIRSEIGKGTTFALRLPLTLAIIQGLLVRVRDEIFVIPLHAVIEVVGMTSEDINSIYGQEVVRIREQVIPLIRIGELLDVPGYTRDAEHFYTVVAGVAHHRIGLVVDELLGQQEIVIKTIGSYLKDVSGIAGSTILGDGRVVMILDIGDLIHQVQYQNLEAA